MPKCDHKSIIVIGDAMVDCYLEGDVISIAEDAPVPVLDVVDVTSIPSGATNVANNLAHLGYEVIQLMLMSSDDDPGSDALKDILPRIPLVRPYIFSRPGYKVPIRNRLVDRRGTQLIRFDDWLRVPFNDHSTNQAILRAFDSLLSSSRANKIGCVVLCDHGKGMLTDDFVVSEILARAAEAEVPTLVDPHGTDVWRYADSSVLILTLEEAEALVILSKDADKGRLERAQYAAGVLVKSLPKVGLAAIIVTAGKHGMVVGLRGANGPEAHIIPAYPKLEVYDGTGTGDVALAILAAKLSDGVPILAATRSATLGAAIAAGRRGISVITDWDLEDAELDTHQRLPDKLAEFDIAKSIVEQAKQEGRRVAYIHGEFDSINWRVLKFLQRTRTDHDLLIVGLFTKDTTKNSLERRIQFLEALECVDLLLVCKTADPTTALEILQPNYYWSTQDEKLNKAKLDELGIKAKIYVEP